jgi:hypothetical protein
MAFQGYCVLAGCMSEWGNRWPTWSTMENNGENHQNENGENAPP